MKGKIILLVISVVFAIALGEIIVRCSGKYKTYTERTGTGEYVSPFNAGFGDGFETVGHMTWYRIHTPHEKIAYSNNEFSASWTANNEGLNDTTFTTDKTGIRIMVLGDSFTDGCGSTNDSSYPQLLGKIVRDSLSQSGVVWNCGVGGSDILFEYMLLRGKLLKYKPDMVIVTVNNTDIQEAMIRGGFERFHQDGTTHYRKGPWFEPLFAHSFLVRGFVFDVLHYNWQFVKADEEKTKRDTAIGQLIVGIDSFATLCHDKNVNVVFAFHPMLNELQNKSTYALTPLVQYCRDKGYDYVDTREIFYKMGIDSVSASSLYWRGDGHFNNTGYGYMARSVWGEASGILKRADTVSVHAMPGVRP